MNTAWRIFLLVLGLLLLMYMVVCSLYTYHRRHHFPLSGRNPMLTVLMSACGGLWILYVLVFLSGIRPPCYISALAYQIEFTLTYIYFLRIWILLFRTHIAAHVAIVAKYRGVKVTGRKFASIILHSSQPSDSSIISSSSSSSSSVTSSSSSSSSSVTSTVASSTVTPPAPMETRAKFEWYFNHSHYIHPRALRLLTCAEIMIIVPILVALLVTDSLYQKPCTKLTGADFMWDAVATINLVGVLLAAYQIRTEKADGFAIRKEYLTIAKTLIGLVIAYFVLYFAVPLVAWEQQLKMALGLCALLTTTTVSMLKPLLASYRVEQAQDESFLEYILDDEKGRELFIEFLQSEFAAENLLFYLAVEDFKAETNIPQAITMAEEIYRLHIHRSGDMVVNLPSAVWLLVREAFESPGHDPRYYDKVRGGLCEAQREIFNLMKLDSFRRFTKTEKYMLYARELNVKPSSRGVTKATEPTDIHKDQSKHSKDSSKRLDVQSEEISRGAGSGPSVESPNQRNLQIDGSLARYDSYNQNLSAAEVVEIGMLSAPKS